LLLDDCIDESQECHGNLYYVSSDKFIEEDIESADFDPDKTKPSFFHDVHALIRDIANEATPADTYIANKAAPVDTYIANKAAPAETFTELLIA